MVVKIVNGLFFHIDTPIEAAEIISNLCDGNSEVCIYYGDAKSGQPWDKQYLIGGTIKASTTRYKRPLITYRGLFAEKIKGESIVAISQNKQWVYRHPDFPIKGRSEANVYESFFFLMAEVESFVGPNG